MARDDHRASLCGEMSQERPQPHDALGVEAVGRLVEQQDRWVTEQGCGERESLAHPEREAAHPAGADLGEADLGQHLVSARVRDPDLGRQHPEMVSGRPARVEPGRLDRRADDVPGSRDVGVGPPPDRGGPGGRAHQPQQHAQGRRLAGAVRAEEARDATWTNGEAEVVDCPYRAEVLGQSVDADDAVLSWLVHLWSSRSSLEVSWSVIVPRPRPRPRPCRGRGRWRAAGRGVSRRWRIGRRRGPGR